MIEIRDAEKEKRFSGGARILRAYYIYFYRGSGAASFIQFIDTNVIAKLTLGASRIASYPVEKHSRRSKVH